MSESWDVYLTFSEGSSNKFWRARVEDGKLYINFGRIGTNGQTQIKDLGDDAAAAKERDKTANSKRKKGYADEAQEPSAEPEAAPVEEAPVPIGPQTIDLALAAEGRKVDLRLVYEGTTVRTVVVEHYENATAAGAALARIKQAMLADGYKAVERDDL